MTTMCSEADYLREEYSTQGFVNYYIGRFLDAEGYYWLTKPDPAYEPEPAHYALYDVCRIFEKKNACDLNPLVDILLREDKEMNFTFNRFVEVVDALHRNNDEGHVQMPYGRLVALFTFAGLAALKLVRKNQHNTISDLALYTGRYIDKGIKLQWPEAGRSWAGFVEMTRVIIDRFKISEENERRLASQRRTRTAMLGVTVVAVIGIAMIAWRQYR